MVDTERAYLREMFDAAAERYDRARPGYPRQLFEDLVELAELRPGARVLEIGPGTGQATLPLAERGFEIIAVELGPALAAVARQKLKRFGAVEVVVAAFEDWQMGLQSFDLVVCATAFHWLDPAVRMQKVAAALRQGGTFATIATHHISGGTEAFFVEMQACYERFDPATPPGLRQPRASEIPADTAELDESGLFQPATFRRYEWEQTYSTAAYLDLLLTYSGHRALDAESQSGLLGCIASLIDTRYGGSIRKPYLNELRLARRRD
jgi:SAM-dependent methyltransferase